MSLANAPMFASIPAHDSDRARRWYEEKLGVTPALEMGDVDGDNGEMDHARRDALRRLVT